MKLKQIRDKNNKKLFMKNKKNSFLKTDKKFTNFKKNNSSVSNFSSLKENKKNANHVFKKTLNKKTLLYKKINKISISQDKPTDANLLIKKSNKNIRNNSNIHNIKNNFIDRKKIDLSINNSKKNKRHNKFFLNKSEKNFFQKNKKFKLNQITNSILQQKFNKPSQILNKKIIIRDDISVLELSNKMAVKSTRVIQNLLRLGFSATIHQILDKDIAQLVAEDMGHEVRIHQDNEIETALLRNRNHNNSIKKLRPPIVTIMGHVDHGKTSLLDYIRTTKIVSKESGGITQHIGAYHVNTSHGIITFLDTPGHAAFTAMRARGAKITDIVVLVVAADDGVMPQTIEAIQHAKSAKVPIIVAINKIDKIESNINHITRELLKYSIVSEELGGENIFVSVSAKTGFGIDHLLSVILLQAEILELKSIYNGMASGVVIESSLNAQRGPVATVLVYEGTLKVNDIAICGLEYGKIKSLKNELHQKVLQANPSIPVEIFGLSGVPKTGDILTVVDNEKTAKEVSLYRKKKLQEKKFSYKKNVDIDNLFNKMTVNKNSELNVILKADVQGSVEAILDSLQLLSNKKIKVNIVMSGVGFITETDVSLSITTSSLLIGFNVKTNLSAKKIIESENIDFRSYSIIYDLINDIKLVISGLSTPKHRQKIVGLATVKSIFKMPKFGFIVGCIVTQGVVKKNNSVRILRNNVVIHEGELESLRRFKDDVSEVRKGTECGIGIKNYKDVHIGDVIELFQLIK